MKDKDIANLDMKKAGEFARDSLRDEMVKVFYERSLLVDLLLANLPPDKRTRVQKALGWIKDKWEAFRISLSKKIYDWSSYEDQW